MTLCLVLDFDLNECSQTHVQLEFRSLSQAFYYHTIVNIHQTYMNYIDNVFYYLETVIPTEPTIAAPTPTLDQGVVISMFSDAYSDVPVDTWLTVWSEGALEDVFIDGNIKLNGIVALC